ncbi:hypothetical protein NliqN6_3710 [Naganishia liquefaciens]|uniref:Tetratricopeptide repeat protein n=1 Tax=Naganishia liquefaciens TaxID=104408 RepID=A0A8H3YFH8_9TREE|nr:hypothetical protein NliqN6_3710 [Naganishia liquefaciens]
MNFDWAAWHKKFDDLGISTGIDVDSHPKFPGSFPEAEETTSGEAKVDEPQSDGGRGTAKDKDARHNAPQSWRQEMDEEAEDPVWQEHLDKLQASGKLKDRKDGYAAPDEAEAGMQEVQAEPALPHFTIDELQEMLTDAECLRKDGNELYKSGKEIDLEAAIETYQRALSALPETSLERARKASQEGKRANAAQADVEAAADTTEKHTTNVPMMPDSGIVEVTDEQAAALEEEEDRKREEAIHAQRQAEEMERNKANDQVLQVEEKIEEIKGFLYGNISAAYVALNKDNEAVEAASKSLTITPDNAKVRLRRAKVNEKIGKYTSLSEALEDYKYLQSSLPPHDPRMPQVRHAVSTLPTRIQAAGKEEMDKMMGQMKEWGDSVLGWFGMKCDDFKTETRADGSTTININKSG